MVGGLHAIEHAMIAILPLYAMCDRWDIGGVSTEYHPELPSASIFIYDAYPGGIGLVEKGFEIIKNWVKNVLNVIENCPCKNGCPGCIMSPKCGNENTLLDKEAAIMILYEILNLKPYIPKPIEYKGSEIKIKQESNNQVEDPRKKLRHKIRKKLRDSRELK
ncbi:MAG: Zn-binding domain-containing protein [Candidatus Helarchaeota archaeon]